MIQAFIVHDEAAHADGWHDVSANAHIAEACKSKRLSGAQYKCSPVVMLQRLKVIIRCERIRKGEQS